MADNDRSEHLSYLRTRANHSLRSFLRRGGFTSPGTGPRRRVDNRVPPTVPQTGANVRLLSGTTFLDDERGTRALAKEIKRLITEDRRRGLNI